MLKESIEEQARRLHKDTSAFDKIPEPLQGPRYEATQTKNLRAWERYRDIVDIFKILLPHMMRHGVYVSSLDPDPHMIAGPPEDCARSAMAYAKAAMALLDAEQPKED